MDVFALPYGERFILYAPLKRLGFLVNAPVVDAVRRRAANPAFSGGDGECRDILSFLSATGFFEPAAPPAEPDAVGSFRPTSVTLFLTNQCNLRCVYCYASAGESAPITMSWEVAKAAADYVIGNAVAAREREVQIGFHGGGEPTLAWGVLQRVVEYFQASACEHGLTPCLHIATNGVLTPDRTDWIIGHLTSANISLDGLADVQNAQRPRIGGGGSFAAVRATMTAMDARGFSYGVRATVTKGSAPEMGRFTSFLARRTACRQVHFEPTFSCGRCVHSGTDGPDAAAFIRGFREACAAAKGHPLDVLYSGARLYTVTDRFCQAAGESFCLTPSGDVTSCYEVTTPDDPRSGTFFYGRYDPGRNEFVYFGERLQRLRDRTVANIAHCGNCFCKYHCAGDCLTRATDGQDLTTIVNPARCEINQALTLDQIARTLTPAAGS
jgi:uncharacterized protein